MKSVVLLSNCFKFTYIIELTVPTSLIIDLHPRVSWSHLRDGQVMVKHGVMDKSWLNSPITKSHSGLDQQGQSTQSLPSRYHSHLPTWALKSPSRTMGSPVGALSTTTSRNSKMVRYSLLLFGLWIQTATHLLQNPCCVWRGAQLTLAGTSQPLAQVQAPSPQQDDSPCSYSKSFYLKIGSPAPTATQTIAPSPKESWCQWWAH